MLRKFTVGLLGASLLASSLYAKEIELCVYTSDKAHTMKKKIGPLADYLKKNLTNVSVKFKVYPNYKKAIDALVRGKCDIARFGPASYTIAKSASTGLRIIAIEQKGGEKVNYGHFVVSQDSKIKKLADIKGKKLAFGNKLSTIGRFLAQDELINVGIGKNDLTFKYFKRHDEVAGKVFTKRFDVGVLKAGTLKKYKSRNLKTIHKFKCISKPWIATASMDKALFSKIQELFLNLNDKVVLRALKKDGFMTAKDSDFNTIRRAIKSAKKFD